MGVDGQTRFKTKTANPTAAPIVNARLPRLASFTSPECSTAKVTTIMTNTVTMRCGKSIFTAMPSQCADEVSMGLRGPLHSGNWQTPHLMTRPFEGHYR